MATTSDSGIDNSFKNYQTDPSFPPDKTSFWSDHSKDDDHWVLSHNSLRGELEELDKCLSSLQAGKHQELEIWQIACLISVWTYHYDHVQKHHDSEETILQPFVATRFRYPDSISGGHKELEAKLDQINSVVVELQEGGTIQPFADLFRPYKDFLLEHLQEEERVAIPLIHAYFTPEEFKETGKAMGKAGGHAGSFVYYIGADKFRNETMAKLGIPFFVWYVAFKSALNEYEQQVIRNVTALQEGKPPEPGGAEKGWFGLF